MSVNAQAHIPYDQRLARWLVRPLVNTQVHPNHLTALSFVLGAIAAALFAFGGAGAVNLAAGVYVLAVFTDHTDGELARQSGKTSPLGHKLDFIVGGLNYTLLFCGIGIGQLSGELGVPGLLLGLAAGLSNPFILYLRLKLDERWGKKAWAHPAAAGFELEDFIYLIGPITWILGLKYFFVPYALGTLGYLFWTIIEYRRWVRSESASNTHLK
ncbi:MAG: CDP-alcohol phosphatidyltransferase family protein [Gammaproteobacteria bacterium]